MTRLFSCPATALACALGLTLSAALPRSAMAQVQPNRFVTVQNESLGYVQLFGEAVAFPDTVDFSSPGAGFRPGVAITILTRNGMAVTPADAAIAFHAAQMVCHQLRRRFDPAARGRMLARGGLLFSGACA
jgi:hypothetical protein